MPRITVSPDELRVGPSGRVRVVAGTFVADEQTVPPTIADVPTGGSATAADNATAINSLLSQLRKLGIVV